MLRNRFCLDYWVCCFDWAKKKKKSLSHDPTSEVVPPHLSELVATACSEGTRACNPSRGPACSSAWPPCGVHFIAVATAGPRRQAGKIQNTDVSMGLQGQPGSCCFGKKYSSYGWAVVKVERNQWVPLSQSRCPPQPPAPSKPLGLEVLISMQEPLVLPHHQAGPAQPSSTSHSSLGFTLTDHPKHLNLEPSLHLAHLNTVVASGRGGGPQTQLLPCFSLFINHAHCHKNLQTAWTMRCIRPVK